ncbi:MAG TPA: MarR family transcriptional regulator [Mycobacteriales bacterium]|nr:MarR family transcriptional regulator [Mycobacteriales bacterium]
MAARIQAQGFDDVTQSHLLLFRHEGIDGRQPGEIAVSSGLSKQSVNDALRYLEDRGYVRRRAHPTDGRARIMRLTARGRRLDAAIRAASHEVEQEWRDRVGDREWHAFVAVLEQMAEGARHGDLREGS